MDLSNLPPGEVASGLLYASFNQDFGCFSVGTENGFRVHTVDPLKEKSRRELADGGIGIVEMLNRSNILALVGGGRSPRYPPNKVIIWDDARGEAIIELEFRSDVRSVRLRRDRIVIVLRNKVFVYSFSAKPTKLYQLETVDNFTGIVALSPASMVSQSSSSVGTGISSVMLACPGRQKGQIQVMDLNASTSSSHGVHATPPISIIPAHTSSLSCLSMSRSGSLIASASEKGTLIRVFDVRSGRLMNELRRGMDKADIYCINFNFDESKLVVASDKGTVHVFNIGPGISGATSSYVSTTSLISPHHPLRHSSSSSHSLNIPTTTAAATASFSSPSSTSFSSSSSSSSSSIQSGNRQSSLSFLSPYLPKYFSSEWSFAQFTLPSECRCIVGFGNTNNNNYNNSSSNIKSLSKEEDRTAIVLAICADGSLYKFIFDLRKGGDGEAEGFYRFYRGRGKENRIIMDGRDWDDD